MKEDFICQSHAITFFCFVYLSKDNLKLSAKQLRPKCYKTIGFGQISLISSLQQE